MLDFVLLKKICCNIAHSIVRDSCILKLLMSLVGILKWCTQLIEDEHDRDDENDTNTVLKWVEQNQTSSPIPSHVAKVLPLVHPEKDLWGQHCYLQQSLVCDDYNNRQTDRHTHTHTHQFNGPLSGTTQVSRYQRGKTNLDFTEAKRRWVAVESAGLMQLCTDLQTDNDTIRYEMLF